jgi:hypothetical protein
MLAGSGCGAFMAGYRTATVRNLALGMTMAGVTDVAGQPQRRAALATPDGNLEVWYYVIAGGGGALEEYPIVFANGYVIAVGSEAVQALAHQGQQPSQAPTVSNDGAPAVTGPADPAQQLAAFYADNPALRGREACVVRVFKLYSPKTWDDLGRLASSICLPSKQWVKVFTDPSGRSTYVDPTRAEVREGSQITFWEEVETFDDDRDFWMMRMVADCDKRFCAIITMAELVAGEYRNANSPAELAWQSVLPGSQAEAVLNTMCAVRNAWIGEARSKGRPQGQGVPEVPRGPATPGI